MSHPFQKIFLQALKKSTDLDNQVLLEAEKLKRRGYRTEEIYDVLETLTKGTIDDAEREILDEACDEFSRYLD